MVEQNAEVSWQRFDVRQVLGHLLTRLGVVDGDDLDVADFPRLVAQHMYAQVAESLADVFQINVAFMIAGAEVGRRIECGERRELVLADGAKVDEVAGDHHHIGFQHVDPRHHPFEEPGPA